MSGADTSQGEGWWQASDGKWYPPEPVPSSLPPPPPPGAGASGASKWDARFRNLGQQSRDALADASTRISEMSGRVEARWRERAREDAEDGPIGATPTESGEWLSLAETGIRLAAASTGAMGPTALIDPAMMLIRATMDIADVQAELLSSIDENVRLLRDGPFQTGRLFLREAQRLSAEPDRAIDFVERALEKFYDAHALAASPIDRAIVELHIGLVSLTLGQVGDAQHWLEEAFNEASGVAQALAEKTGNTDVLKSKWGVAAATYMYPVGAFLVARKRRKVREDEWAKKGLRQVLPLIECVALMHNGLDEIPEPLAPMQLVPIGDGRFELR
jgi:hypothetical protein